MDGEIKSLNCDILVIGFKIGKKVLIRWELIKIKQIEFLRIKNINCKNK